MPIQYDLFGGEQFVGSIQARIEHLLENHPDARDNYKVLILRYWYSYDGLGKLFAEFDDDTRFREWFLKATAAKTIQNRAMEVQRRRPELDASATVRQYRNRQAKAGPVGSR